VKILFRWRSSACTTAFINGAFYLHLFKLLNVVPFKLAENPDTKNWLEESFPIRVPIHNPPLLVSRQGDGFVDRLGPEYPWIRSFWGSKYVGSLDFWMRNAETGEKILDGRMHHDLEFIQGGKFALDRDDAAPRFENSRYGPRVNGPDGINVRDGATFEVLKRSEGQATKLKQVFGSWIERSRPDDACNKFVHS
jgi:hypothetical protein